MRIRRASAVHAIDDPEFRVGGAIDPQRLSYGEPDSRGCLDLAHSVARTSTRWTSTSFSRFVLSTPSVDARLYMYAGPPEAASERSSRRGVTRRTELAGGARSPTNRRSRSRSCSEGGTVREAARAVLESAGEGSRGGLPRAVGELAGSARGTRGGGAPVAVELVAEQGFRLVGARAAHGDPARREARESARLDSINSINRLPRARQVYVLSLIHISEPTRPY